MNNQLDSQKNQEKWISLTEYSQKHSISISTLRRRIRAQIIPVKIKEGKYFLQDKTPQAEVGGEEKAATFKPLLKNKHFLTQSFKEEDKKTSSPQDKQSVMNKMLDSQAEFYKLLAAKDKKIENLQTRIDELNTLTALLEKDNKELKAGLEREKKLEEWLNS